MSGRKQKFKPLKPGTYILGEGITEKFYFEHLKSIYKLRITISPRFFCNTCFTDMAKKVGELLQADITIICVFDADNSNRSLKEKSALKKLKTDYSDSKNVIICDSMPSIEYWFLLHFKDTCPVFQNSKEVEKDLKKFINDYKKTESFLKKERWVKDMSQEKGSLINARKYAVKYKKSQTSYTNVYKGIAKLFSSTRH